MPLGIDQVRENVVLALDALRVSRLRSALTILGVVIGVATVMTMATIVQGIQDQIVTSLEVAGPTTFYVFKIFSKTPIDPQRLPKYVRIRPDISEAEAKRVAALPEVGVAALWAQVFGRLEFNGARTRGMAIFGADDRYQEFQGGELLAGRWFTKAEMRSGASVVVVSEVHARRIFGRVSPLGKLMLVAGRPATVIGLYQAPSNIFAPPGQDAGAIIPFAMMDHQLRIDKTNALWIPVKPKAGVSVAAAQEAVITALREMRKLRPGDKNTFDLITQDQVLDIFTSITGIFFLVMIVLASVALLVGGIGVMAIMMVSVTARTREIGVRKALGATRADILVQFLIEAATLTGIGGVLGIVVGLLAGKGVSLVLSIQAKTPLGLTLIALGVSVGIGLVFGVVPARRAARLDPIEALRYE